MIWVSCFLSDNFVEGPILTAEVEKQKHCYNLKSCWITSFDNTSTLKQQINTSPVNKSFAQWAKWDAALISVTGDTCADRAISSQNGCC